MQRFQATAYCKVRDLKNKAFVLSLGKIVTEEDLAPVAFADCVERGLLVPVDQITPTQAAAVAVQAVANAAREEGKEKHAGELARLPEPLATREIEGLDEKALRSLDLDSLLVSVIERVKTQELQRPVADAIKGMDEPKEGAIAFLTAKFEQQAEFIDKVAELVAERAAADEANEKADALDTIVRDDE